MNKLEYGRPADHEDEEANEPRSDRVLGLVLLQRKSYQHFNNLTNSHALPARVTNFCMDFSPIQKVVSRQRWSNTPRTGLKRRRDPEKYQMPITGLDVTFPRCVMFFVAFSLATRIRCWAPAISNNENLTAAAMPVEVGTAATPASDELRRTKRQTVLKNCVYVLHRQLQLIDDWQTG